MKSIVLAGHRHRPRPDRRVVSKPPTMVCTCIRDERDPQRVVILDPECPRADRH